MYIFIIIFMIPFLITMRALKNSGRVAIETRALNNKEDEDIAEEMMIHQALERIGAMPSHHKREKELEEKKDKRVAIYIHNLFQLLGYLIISVEIWYLYILLSNLSNH